MAAECGQPIVVSMSPLLPSANVTGETMAPPAGATTGKMDDREEDLLDLKITASEKAEVLGGIVPEPENDDQGASGSSLPDTETLRLRLKALSSMAVPPVCLICIIDKKCKFL